MNQPPNTTSEKSVCCGATFHCHEGKEGTNYYICDKCDRACDILFVIVSTPTEQVKNFGYNTETYTSVTVPTEPKKTVERKCCQFCFAGSDYQVRKCKDCSCHTLREKTVEKLYHQENCRGCRGLYISGESLFGNCTCIPLPESTPIQTGNDEWITKYDMRGEWCKEEYKESIRKQINEKISDFIQKAVLQERELCVKIVNEWHINGDVMTGSPASYRNKTVRGILSDLLDNKQ
jgi:hypothetical protein